ncbi:futalosine hydrolase [Streptomyces physcomitrii]|uniref:Futalosine hydrolase n=1 Tax=Streptomyces physcomitrii TaxID=2724184 RepID=A0ABX1HBH8_9ACTN|nr:futalosine hydrolase [Streptomyces physcomitrii]NKI45488.1 futalosine hydrolase [Streptomyces physcomitrii]
MSTVRLLVVTAVQSERDAVARGLDPTAPALPHPLPGHEMLRTTGGGGPHPLHADLLAAGVGPAAAAAATGAALTAAALREQPYDLVITAGIAGGFAPVAPLGSVVVADRVVAADLGAESPEGFVAVDDLGFGRSSHPCARHLGAAVARALGAVHAPVLTVSTVTGTAERAQALRTRYEGAAAEAMEGFGVAEAAAAHGVPLLEIRTVSNPVGPRDRAAWRIPDALSTLCDAFGVLRTVLDRGAPPPYS